MSDLVDSEPDAYAEAARRVAEGGDAATEAAGLVAEMTLVEKLDCLDGDIDFWAGMGDMTSGGYHRHPWPAAAVERLGVPGLAFADGPRGCVLDPATCFPVAMARGAAFDPDLERRVGDAIGTELRARGATFTGAVCINLLRHPGWGRAQETYGEDPHHVGEMGAAFVEGLQAHVMACAKHFALNSMENARFSVDVTVDDRALHEVYLPHFRRVVEAGVASIMSAYNSVNGDWCGENATLLTTILRDEWGFDGAVISDFVFGLRDPIRSVTAGLDVEMPFRQQRAHALADAIEQGHLDEAAVDESVARTIGMLLSFADRIERRPAASTVLSDTHRSLAREAAASSMTLVRNESSLLPIDAATVSKVAVLGRLAAVANLGDGGSSAVHPPSVVTPLAGVEEAFAGAQVEHADSDAAIAEEADLTVVVVGYTAEDEGEFLDMDTTATLMHLFPPMPDGPEGFELPDLDTVGDGPANESADPTPGDAAPPTATTGEGFLPGGDRRSLRLSDADETLIDAACERSDRVVVVVMSGSAVVMPWLEQTGATLMIWYPGMEGGRALADVLTGRVEPGGRLPFAVPRDEVDLVAFDPDADAVTYDLFHGQWLLDRDGVAAHLPFGWGLGYTTWETSSPTTDMDGAVGTVSMPVRNTGERAGSLVVQVYGSRPGSAFERPQRRLVGFTKATVEPGAADVVDVDIDLTTLAVRRSDGWLVEKGDYELIVGLHANDPVADSVTVTI